MKRIFLSLAILGVCSIGIFAQETDAQENEMKKNSAGFSFTIFGAETHYERNFNNYLSVLGSVSYTTLFIADAFTVSAKGRWYPFGKTWYLGLGAGYMYGGVSDYYAAATAALPGIFMAAFVFPPVLIIVPFILIGDAAESIRQISRESGFLAQTNLGWKIPSGRKEAVLIDTGIDFNVTGISRLFRAVIDNNTEYLDQQDLTKDPKYLLRYLLPYIRIGYDFKF